MEGVVTRGCDLILPGCGWTPTLALGAAIAARWFCDPQQISNPLNESGVSAPCGGVWTRAITVAVPGLLEMYIYGRVFDPGTGLFPPRVRLDSILAQGAIFVVR